MTFYGFEHRYGANMRDESGATIGRLFVFQTAAARNAWVEAGNPYQHDPGARTVMPAKRAKAWTGAVHSAADLLTA